MCIVSGVPIRQASRVEGTVTHALAVRSKRWKERAGAIDTAAESCFGDEGIGQDQPDMPFGATHFVVVDGVTAGKFDDSAMYLFKNALVQRVSEQLPSLAIQTLDCRYTRLPFLQDYVGRGLPVLLLDTRPLPLPLDRSGASAPAYPSSIAEAGKAAEQLDRELQENGTSNTYVLSLLAFLHIVLRRELSSDAGGNGTGTTAAVGGELWRIIGHMQAKEQQQQDTQRQRAHSIAGGAQRASSKSLADAAASIMQDQVQRTTAADVRRERQRLERVLAALDGSEATRSALGGIVQHASKEWGMYNSAIGKNDEAVQRHPTLFEIQKGIKNGELWQRVMCLRGDLSDESADEALQAFRSFVSNWRDDIAAKEEQKEPLSREIYMGMQRLLTSDNVHSCNVRDTDLVSQKIAAVAKIDRLPAHNSFEAQKVLRGVWDHVDIFTQIARSCKQAAKALYLLLLLLGLVVTTIVTISFNTELIDDEHLSAIVLGLSLAGTLIGTVVAFLNPAQRWQQLRGAALSLDSEIWKFRTRTGQYTLPSSSGLNQHSRHAEKQLMACLDSTSQHVSKSASVMETTFFAKFDFFGESSHLRYYTHGQYEGAKSSGTFGMSVADDNHQSPLKPHEYLNFRVEPASRYYQTQLPLYYRSRVAAEVVLVTGAFVGTILAFYGVASWAAIATSVTSAVTAWKEFNGTDKKLTRYSNTIGKLKGTVMWWEQLSEVEQASLVNVNRLVLECEDTLEREREAWLSTSMATKALVKAASGDSQGAANSGEKDGAGAADGAEAKPTSKPMLSYV